MNYKELGINIPDETPMDDLRDWEKSHKEGRHDGIYRDMLNNGTWLESFAFRNDWNSLRQVLAIARDLEDQAIFHASLRKPEAMAEDQLRIQYRELLNKLPKIERYEGHNFSARCERSDFVEAGIEPEVVSALFLDSKYHRERSKNASFDLRIKKDLLEIKNHYSPVYLALQLARVENSSDYHKVGNFGLHATSPWKTELDQAEQEQLEKLQKSVEGLGEPSITDDEISLYTIGAKYHMASALIDVAGRITDTYLASLAPYTQKAV